ncbi:hypothetical protein B0H13DRAFT_1933949 [Mycena leptocephala]|nr:hypothetical protein B0H13DRAFT_1933949 [Mycena leptocephala]
MSGKYSGIPGQTSPFIQGPDRTPIRGDTHEDPLEDGVGLNGTEQEAWGKKGSGEESVSEDDTDELSPFLMVIPSDMSPPSKLLFDDHVAEKNSFHAHYNSIPPIYSLAKNGISPPHTLFLLESLERVLSSNVKTVKHGTPVESGLLGWIQSC